MPLSLPLLTALHLTPLLTSTASLTHAYMEYVTTRAFLIQKPPVTSSVSKGILGISSPVPPITPERKKEIDDAKEVVIPAWFTAFFSRGIYSVVGLNSLTLFSSLSILYLRSARLVSHRENRGVWSNNGGATPWYAAGALAALAHYAFVPLVAGSVRGLVGLCAGPLDEEGKTVGGERGAREWLEEWVGRHCVRMGSVDLIAWGCFFVGGLKAVCEM